MTLKKVRTPLTPVLLTAIAESHVGHEEPVASRTLWVRAMLSEAGLPPNANWGVAFVSHVGYSSHRNASGLESSWPLPRTGDANDLAAFATERGVLCREPEIADIALVWKARAKRYVSAGIVVDAMPLNVEDDGRYRVTTIEGNVSPLGSPHGRGVYRVTRSIRPRSGMRFVRWVDLDVRDAVSDPTQATEVSMGRIVAGTIEPARTDLRRCA